MTETEITEYKDVIDKIMEAIPANDAFSSPTVLASFVVRLAHANAMYGHCLGPLHAQYKYLRKEIYAEQMKSGSSVTAAKEAAEHGSISEKEAYENAYNIFNGTKDFITVCMSYLKIMGIEARLGNV